LDPRRKKLFDFDFSLPFPLGFRNFLSQCPNGPPPLKGTLGFGFSVPFFFRGSRSLDAGQATCPLPKSHQGTGKTEKLQADKGAETKQNIANQYHAALRRETCQPIYIHFAKKMLPKTMCCNETVPNHTASTSSHHRGNNKHAGTRQRCSGIEVVRKVVTTGSGLRLYLHLRSSACTEVVLA
jgi:hypothetical protein